MRERTGYLLLVALLSIPLAIQAREPMRCGNELVDRGDTKEQVLRACGEPDYVDGYRWYYQTGQTEPARIVVFTPAGIVTAIETVR